VFCEELRLEEARRHRVAADPVGTGLDRNAARDLVHPGLGGGVGAFASPAAVVRRHGGHVHDRAAADFAHAADERADHVPVGIQVDGDDLVERVGRVLEDAPLLVDRGVVDEDVDRSELGRSLCDGGVHRHSIGDVDVEVEHRNVELLAQCVTDRARALLVVFESDDGRSFARKLARARRSDSRAARTRDQRDPAFETPGHEALLFPFRFPVRSCASVDWAPAPREDLNRGEFAP